MARKGAWAWKRIGALHVLRCMWMLCPNQASSLQGCHRVSGASLAVENWGDWLRLATEQAKLSATCSGGIVELNALQ